MAKAFGSIFFAVLLGSVVTLAASKNPLLKAVQTQDSVAVKKLLQKPSGRAKINSVDGSGGTLLIIAAEAGNDEILTTLLTAKPNIEAEDNAGFTALYYALVNHNDTSAMLLIGAGAKLNHVVTGGKTALMAAAAGGCRESLQKILGVTVDARGPIDAQDAAGETALFYAVRTAHFSLAQNLLRAGANKDILNKAGKSALQTALDAGLPKEHSLYKSLVPTTP